MYVLCYVFVPAARSGIGVGRVWGLADLLASAEPPMLVWFVFSCFFLSLALSLSLCLSLSRNPTCTNRPVTSQIILSDTPSSPADLLWQ